MVNVFFYALSYRMLSVFVCLTETHFTVSPKPGPPSGTVYLITLVMGYVETLLL